MLISPDFGMKKNKKNKQKKKEQYDLFLRNYVYTHRVQTIIQLLCNTLPYQIYLVQLIPCVNLSTSELFSRNVSAETTG